MRSWHTPTNKPLPPVPAMVDGRYRATLPGTLLKPPVSFEFTVRADTVREGGGWANGRRVDDLLRWVANQGGSTVLVRRDEVTP